VRIFLSLVVALSGLLMAREFMAHSNEQPRLTLHGAKVVAEQSIATLREPPALVAPMAVVPMADVSEKSLATVREPPTLAARTTVVRIAQVSEQNLATAHQPPAPAARMTECEQIWDQMTHMTREEWAEVCRRVEAEKQARD